MSLEIEILARKLHLVVLPTGLWAAHVDPHYNFIAFSHVTLNVEKVIMDKGLLLTFENNQLKTTLSINDEIVQFPNLTSSIQQISDISFLLCNLEQVRICENINSGFLKCSKYVLNSDNSNFCDYCTFKVFSEEQVSIQTQSYLDLDEPLLLETNQPESIFTSQQSTSSNKIKTELCDSNIPTILNNNSANADIEFSEAKDHNYLCTVCGKTFDTPSVLDRHMFTHTDDKPFKCKLCSKTFAKKYNLNVHLRVHSGERPYICSKCGKTFATSSNLSTHMKSFHCEEKKHACEFCKMTFVYPRVLRIHMRKHTGEKPFGCHLCPKVFTKKVHLTIHLRTHTGEKPFICSLCGKGFATTGNLSSHKKTNHKI